ncbi:root UVB sensitive protein [Actinidia rufa]|uniref:Root UVB sensitive protein n=1 Tax=Actinidia rufa TaxID=165716 RepID=A0A7J0E799_9ERIC|nr:root UVB sensitive protein [Actinidia rufa]
MSYTLQSTSPTFAFDSSRNWRKSKVRQIQVLCSSTPSEPSNGNPQNSRYILDNDLHVRTFLEEKGIETNGFHGSQFSNVALSWLPDVIRDFILPAGFPVQAVGVGSFSGTTAAASAAAIRWVSKDGIGAVGRLFIGGRFGNLFDDDPKQWRMYADFIGSAGSIFDLTTQLYPAYFLPLASLGNLTKEEVWEVAAQLLGLSLGILILDAPGVSASYLLLGSTWMTMRLLHLWLRYQSLSVLQFNSINLKRARILVKSHVLHATIPGCVDCNRMENILLWQRFLKPRIVFGVSLEEMLGGQISVSMVKILLKLYAKEKYILVVNKQQKVDFDVFVSFKVGATSLSVLRSVWQTYWLHQNWDGNSDFCDQLEQSLGELEGRFQNFMEQLEEAGWNTHQLSLKVPKEQFFEETGVI